MPRFKLLALGVSSFGYRYLARPIFFLFDSEVIHHALTRAGEWFGRYSAARSFLDRLWRVESPLLRQTVAGIDFRTPVGLAAGFDYEGRLTQILPSLGFGFGTVGTITNKAYEGNAPPRLGRLVQSRSLLVNKGFKNEGIKIILNRFAARHFASPVGLSLGKTNTLEIKNQAEAVADVVAAFRQAEAATQPNFAYYELNISCPNLKGNIEFYEPEHLRELLAAVTGLRLHRPLFIKMPITRSDEETRAMLRVVSTFSVAGVIFGNLQSNRQDPSLQPAEGARAGKGHFSGRPTAARSNELIRLTYREFGERLVIIGCGGIFSAADAYTKIRLGATLVQLITGLIYEGPQLPGEISLGLIKLLRRDGLNHLAEAIGRDA